MDSDQIQNNLKTPEKRHALSNPDHLDVDKPGLGLFYCIECDRHFPSEVDRSVHLKSKLHKRQAKRIHEEKAYTVEESLWAAGVGIDNQQRDQKKTDKDQQSTQPTPEKQQQQQPSS